ncbi:hypothetical protein BC833DRAFT_599994 [Globomyces pollinis-pini]|nr:hypothetical protein BC833DRAFT_599994 [Globomyces pollinis-pini]KAJ2999345.1 hypothetical protein HDV02_003126 [Globomyces sp. JEL0801]
MIAIVPILISSVWSCTKDLLLDDFAKIDYRPLLIETPPPDRYFNLVGGDYGAKDQNFTINTKEKFMEITADWGPADTSESDTHPGGPTAHNYWYSKFDPLACFDLSPYTALQFDIKAPAGTDMYFTLTQHAPGCKKRLIDSVYQNLTKYITPDGTKKTVKIPLSDFGKNLVGKDFDFKYLKDFTTVNLIPKGVVIQMSNMLLKGNCDNAGSGSSTTGTSPTSKNSVDQLLPSFNSLWTLLLALIF